MLRAAVRRAGPLAAPCLRGAVAGLLLAVVLHWGHILLLGNFRAAAPGRVYRAGQLGSRRLEEVIRRYGIRTVVNLRGPGPSAQWYREELAAVARAGASLEDVTLSATRLPSMESARQLVEVLERAEYPILIHCHQGADRTGLAVASYFLLRTGVPLAEARRHLGLQTGHVAVGRTGRIDRFFDLYEEWLAGAGGEHTPERFRDWMTRHYCPDHGCGRVEWLGLAGGLGKVRAHNTSLRPWRFDPGPNAGIGLAWTLRDGDGQLLRHGRSGLLEAVVEPGGHIDVQVPLGPLPPGRYELALDLAEGSRGTFLQLGNDLTTVELVVP